MKKEVFTFIVGGKAGEGVKKAGNVASHIFSAMGRRIFQMDDYQSLIKGGHNFSVISTSTNAIYSHYMKADLIVALDSRSYEIHKNHLAENGTMVFNSDEIKHGDGIGIPMKSEAKNFPNPELRIGISGVAILAAAIGLDKDRLAKIIIEEYKVDLDNNISFASNIYDQINKQIKGKFPLTEAAKKRPIFTGNEAIALGAAAAGLDIYFAYPMTPSSSILHFLAAHEKELDMVTIHPENEIAVANMAIGAAYAGARTMVGSSGGGFALMEEAFSLAGMTETPFLGYLGSRPGPSTGLPTYSDQADLFFALNQGHGEFPRIVASPGSIEEAFYLAAEMLNLVWHFQTPGILLTEKHMAESSMTVSLEPEKIRKLECKMHKSGEFKRYLNTDDGISPLLFPPSKEWINWNSYEHDEMGVTTENPEITIQLRDKRNTKLNTILQHMKNMKTVNKFGTDGPVIFTYGSTTMSVLEALRAGKIKATVVQPIYLKPFPVWELNTYKGKKAVIVEQSSTGQFATLLKEKACIDSQAVIKKYDGRPFDPIKLADELKEVM
jgi:2-oxoglutarate ferredoxin oxidoreductase subunit alpha